MKYVSNGCPEDEARLCFAGCSTPIYKLDQSQLITATIPVEENDEPAIYGYSLEYFDFSNRTANVMARNGITTVKELISLTKAQFKEFRGVGVTILDEVEQHLLKNNLSFADDADDDEFVPRKRRKTVLVRNAEGNFVLQRIG